MFCTACAAPNPIAAPRCAACGADVVRLPPRAGATGMRRRSASPRTTLPRHTAALVPRTAPPRRGLLRILYLVPLLALLATGAVMVERRQAARAELAAGYFEAATAAAAGRHQEAALGFAAVAGYRDADARHAAAVAALAPYRVAYEDGVTALEAGRFADAVAALLPVARDQPNFADAPLRLADARRRHADDLRREVDAAEARRDWVGAERALGALIGADPGDVAAPPRLAALRREHGPILLARDQALYLVSPDGGDERLLTDALPALWPTWSPDRSRVAFLSPVPAGPAEPVGDRFDLHVVGADGSGLARLAGDVAAHTAPVWRPDGTGIAYTSFAAFDWGTDRGRIGVRVVDVSTGRETDVSGSALPFAVNPSWSPTGDRIAFVAKEGEAWDSPFQAPGRVRVVTLVTGQAVDLTGDRLPGAWSLAWSPTAERLLVFAFLGGNFYEPLRSEIRLLDTATGEIGTVPSDTPHVRVPVWSPDGARFAFAEGETTVRVRSWEGEEATIDVGGKAGAVTWAPDGGALLAAGDDPRQPSTLITLDGSGAAAGEPAPVLGALPTTVVPLVFDYARPFYGPPQWAPLQVAPPAGPPAIGGTGLDHDAG